MGKRDDAFLRFQSRPKVYRLNGSALKVCLALGTYVIPTNPDCTFLAWPSQRDLAREMGLDQRAVSQALTAARKAGAITWTLHKDAQGNEHAVYNVAPFFEMMGYKVPDRGGDAYFASGVTRNTRRGDAKYASEETIEETNGEETNNDRQYTTCTVDAANDAASTTGANDLQILAGVTEGREGEDSLPVAVAGPASASVPSSGAVNPLVPFAGEFPNPATAPAHKTALSPSPPPQPQVYYGPPANVQAPAPAAPDPVLAATLKVEYAQFLERELLEARHRLFGEADAAKLEQELAAVREQIRGIDPGHPYLSPSSQRRRQRAGL